MEYLYVGALEPLPIPTLLDRAVAAFPERPALSFSGRRWSYRALAALADRAAAGLQALGVAPGDRVGLCLPNTPYSVILYYAVLRIGAVVVNYNPLYVARELREQIVDSRTTTMVVPDLADTLDKVVALAPSCGISHVVVCPIADGCGALDAAATVQPPQPAGVVSFAQLIAGEGAPRLVPIDPVRDLAVLQYTGGTTGVPKGAMLTHANLSINVQQVMRVMPGLRPGQERMMVVLPLFHVFAMTSVMNSGIALAAELILHPRFEIEAVMASLALDRPTLLHAVPTIYGAIAAAASETTPDISCLTACICGGAPLPAELGARFEALTGCRIIEGYGLTEASPVVTLGLLGGERRAGSVGQALSGAALEIRDPADISRLLPPGRRGEICVRGPQVMAGYLGREAETAQSVVDGALRTGDVGYLDADGFLFITDRLKDVIICSGFNVYPRMIEDALYEHPAVAEVIAIGMPDAYRGQTPLAFVTLRPGHTAEPAALRAFLRGHLSPIELPSRIEIRERLPRTAVGKLSRRELAAEITQAEMTQAGETRRS